MSKLLPLVFLQEQWRMKGLGHWCILVPWACQLCFLLPGKEPLPPTSSPLEALWGPPLRVERSQQNLLWPYPHPMVSFRWWQPSESRSWRELLLETWHHWHVTSGGKTNVPSESRSVVSTLCDPMDYTVHGILQARIQPFPSPGDLPNPGIKPRSLTLQVDSLPAEPPGKPNVQKVLLLCWPLLPLDTHRVQFSTCFLGDQHSRKITPTQKLWVNKWRNWRTGDSLIPHPWSLGGIRQSH